MRIASFNVQNLRLRRAAGGLRLDGARDRDIAEDAAPGAEALDAADRALTAAVIREARADLVALQEVFDRATLDHFHDRVLLPAGAAPYPHRVCLPGNDGRGLDVALLSRLPLGRVESHAEETPASLGLAPVPGIGAEDRLFRRDCLEAEVAGLTLFVCHFKAPYPDAAAAWAVRRLEAAAVRRLIARRFADPGAALWLVLGDLNEPAEHAAGPDRAIAPLAEGFAVDLLERLPEGERWSFCLPGSEACSAPDALLASPALAARWPEAVPEVLRAGLGREVARYGGPRLPGVGRHRPHASDHAALALDLPGL